jgi:hypothetical protein
VITWWLLACTGGLWTDEAVVARTTAALATAPDGDRPTRDQVEAALLGQDPLTFDGPDTRRGRAPQRRTQKAGLWERERFRQRRDTLLWLRAEAEHAGVTSLPTGAEVGQAAQADVAAGALAVELHMALKEARP